MFGPDTVTIKIGDQSTGNEQTYEINLKSCLADDATREEIAWAIGTFGRILADAEAEKITADAIYRQWRANQGNAIRKAVKGLPEWRVKQRIESQEAFLRFKQAEAACERNVTILRNLICGLLVRANVQDPNAKFFKEV